MTNGGGHGPKGNSKPAKKAQVAKAKAAATAKKWFGPKRTTEK
jgi:hypothetical protein